MTKTENNLLFVYGTLLMENNPFGKLLAENSELIGSGKFPGELFDLGNYPGAIHKPNAATWVFGGVFKINNIYTLLPQLDYYEGIGSPDCEYKREIIEIETPLGVLPCWTYLYSLNCSDKFKIESGNYLDFLNNRGHL